MLLTRDSGRPRRLLQVVSDAGGAGDQLARLAALRECLRLEPLLDVRWFVKPYMHPLMEACVDLHPYIKTGRLVVISDEEISSQVNRTQPGVQFSKRHTTPGRMGLVEEALLLLADSLTTINGEHVDTSYVVINSTSNFKIDVPYVVVCPNYTTRNRSWKPSEISIYLKWLHDRGYVPVLLGSTKETYTQIQSQPLDTTYAMDYRDMTTLLDAHALLKNARAVVGVDNGLMHLAACNAQPPQLITGFTTILPELRDCSTWEREQVVVTPDLSLDCAFCQSRFNFDFEHDFRECMYGDYKCVEQMTADKFIVASLEVGL